MSGVRAGDGRLARALGDNGFHLRKGRVGLLLVHGLTGTPAEMKPFGRLIAAAGLTVACPQLAGHCTSIADLKATRWPDWYRSVERAFEALDRECDQVFVAGLSAGALLALLLAAAKGRRVSGLILLSVVFFFDGWNVPNRLMRTLMRVLAWTPLRHVMYWRETPPYGIKCARTRARVAAALSSKNARAAGVGYFKTPVTVIQESMRLMREARRSLGRVMAPTLIVHSTEDDTASLENAHVARRHVGAARVETCFIDDTYHVLTLDKRKEDVARRVARFCLDIAGEDEASEGSARVVRRA